MKQNNFKQIVLICTLFFSTLFACTIQYNWPLISKKELHRFDESINSAVSANLTRQIFPAKVRINSLIDQQTVWEEGPYWQHIPPLFTYVPLLLFALDGKVTIEMYRLAYALVLLFTGILFIIAISQLEKTILATLSATLAASCWLLLPFSQNLITGADYGVSDIVLASSIVCSFLVLCWYLKNVSCIRKEYTLWKLICISFVVAMPIIVKNVLGAIPAATFFSLLLYDQKKINYKFLISGLAFLFPLVLYYGALYISSPMTFQKEFFVSFEHFDNYEGWGRPWYYFVISALPIKYFRYFTPIFYLSLLFSSYLVLKNQFTSQSEKILILSGGWFFWNLFVVSAVFSKAPNFIYQSCLLGIFFSIYAPLLYLGNKTIILKKIFLFFSVKIVKWLVFIFFIMTVLTYGRLIKIISKTRADYEYHSPHEQYYHLGERGQKLRANQTSLFILNTSPFDCWFRYYIIFLTGAEARTLDEILSYRPSLETLQTKYKKISLVLHSNQRLPKISLPHTTQNIDDLKILSFDTRLLNQNYLADIQDWIKNSSNNEIYFSTKACYWLPL